LSRASHVKESNSFSDYPVTLTGLLDEAEIKVMHLGFRKIFVPLHSLMYIMVIWRAKKVYRVSIYLCSKSALKK